MDTSEMKTGIVSKYLIKLIERQIAKGLVIWFDPEGVYHDFVQDDPKIVQYTGSFFELRHLLNPLMDQEGPPHLVLYIPMAKEETRSALVEYTSIGIELRPGHPSYTQNTRLSVIARAALRQLRSESQLEEIGKRIDAGQLSLSDVDEISLETVNVGSDLIRLIFGSNDAERVALAILKDENYDQQVVERKAVSDLQELLIAEYGTTLSGCKSVDEMRSRFARYILCTDLLAPIREVPASLVSISIAPPDRRREASARLASSWRQAYDLRDSYALHANQVEKDLDLASVSFTLAQLKDCSTFVVFEQKLQEAIETSLIARETDTDLLLIAQQRLDNGFWARHLDEIKVRWMVISVAGHLLQRASHVEMSLKAHTLTAGEILNAYAVKQHPWCELDTLHRRLEFYYQSIAYYATLEQLVAYARGRYMQTGGMLAEHYTRALQAEGFQTSGFHSQREIYSYAVAPALKEGKTAYILVDALRFEMARELIADLAETYNTNFTLAVGTVPTITPIGMAALLPGANNSVQVVPVSGGKIGLQIGDTTLKDRRGRMEWMRQHATLTSNGMQARVYETTLEKLLASRRDKPDIEKADLVVVTSQEIDELGESDNIGLAHMVMGKILENLSKAINILAQLECKTIIITADHGYIFGEELGSDMKIEPPGGQSVDLHRRVWIGRGGLSSAAYLRTSLAAFSLGDDLDIAVPWGFGAFIAPGGTRAYFHGGMSPQEMVIPVAIIRAPSSIAKDTGTIDWQVTLRSPRITTRFYSVTLGGQSLFPTEIPRVQLEIQAGNEVIATSYSAEYGLSETTGEIQLHFQEGEGYVIMPSKVTLLITHEQPKLKTVHLHLFDAVTRRELITPVELELAITI